MPLSSIPSSKARMGVFFAIIAVVMLFQFVLTSQTQSTQNEQRIRGAIHNCETQKEDRIDSARALTAINNIISANANNPQFNEATKKIYRDNLSTVAESSNQMRRRLLECDPLLRQNKHVIDGAALDEAKGKLSQ